MSPLWKSFGWLWTAHFVGLNSATFWRDLTRGVHIQRQTCSQPSPLLLLPQVPAVTLPTNTRCTSDVMPSCHALSFTVIVNYWTECYWTEGSVKSNFELKSMLKSNFTELCYYYLRASYFVYWTEFDSNDGTGSLCYSYVFCLTHIFGHLFVCMFVWLFALNEACSDYLKTTILFLKLFGFEIAVSPVRADEVVFRPRLPTARREFNSCWKISCLIVYECAIDVACLNECDALVYWVFKYATFMWIHAESEFIKIRPKRVIIDTELHCS